MNLLELYKRLPKKNCGVCSARVCMAFAAAVTRGEADIAECTHLTEDEIRELKGSISRIDWREDLISKLKEEIRLMNFGVVAEGIGAQFNGKSLGIRCMGAEYEIFPDGEIKSVHLPTPWMSILLLHYIRTAGNALLSGRWVAFAELRGGMVKASSFAREAEEPLRRLFDSNPKDTEKALDVMGARREPGFPTDHAFRLDLLPKIPVVILYHPSDDEFPSDLKVLFDAAADGFLDVESLIFLAEGLAHNLQRRVCSPR